MCMYFICYLIDVEKKRITVITDIKLIPSKVHFPCHNVKKTNEEMRQKCKARVIWPFFVSNQISDFLQ